MDELIAAAKRADTLDRTACRRHVEERFSVSRMVDDYETVYYQLRDAREAGTDSVVPAIPYQADESEQSTKWEGTT
jgi:hypothetical protein